jgi:hypothetical protein
MMGRTVLAFVLGVGLVAGAAGPVHATPDDGVTIGSLRAHLFYARSGSLSEDLIGRDPPFSGWNTVIGEGDAKEPAENLLVIARLENPGAEAFLDEKLAIRVSGEKGRKITERVFSGMLLAEHGAVHLPMWIDDAGCLGAVTITVTFREQTLSKPLQLLCGE